VTGISELTHVQVVSAAPERIRLSILGAHTQLDIALPLDVPVSSFVPDLARLVSSRGADRDDDPVGDERRTFWVLSRFDTARPLSPEQTLREAGVANGELLRLSSDRALSPPTLYDDVVDAAARLNKAAYAAWDAVSARWMAFIGTYLGAATLVYLLVGGVFPADRVAKIGIAAVVVLALLGAAAIAWRSYGRVDVATALGGAAIPITAAIGWVLLSGYGPYGIAAGCGILLVLNGAYYRAIGTGHWAYLASAVPVAFGALALLGHAAGLRVDVVCVIATVTAALLSLGVSRLTVRLGRFETPTIDAEVDRDEWAFENPFVAPASMKAERDADSGAAMPTAEAVWTQVRSAALTRAALLTGLAASVVLAATLLLRDHAVVGWPAFTFALAASAVLGLRSRVPDTWFERAGLAVPAVALVVIACVTAQNGRAPIPVTAVGLLLAIAVGAALAAAIPESRHGSHRLGTLLTYLEYVAVASLVPLALWVTGSYERLGHW
jgi:type VII secretion integral membrane protein EccD